MHCKKPDSQNIKIHRQNFIYLYFGKAIKIEQSDSISELEKVDTETFLNGFDVAISGHFEITHQNNEKKRNLKQENGDAINKNGEEEDPSVHLAASDDADADYDADADDDDDEAGDDIKLILEQDFELLSSKISERIIDLKEHVILTKAASPYTFNLTLQYSRNSNMEMKTACSSNADTITSEYGQLQVKNMDGGFAGIKNLHFENMSRREIV